MNAPTHTDAGPSERAAARRAAKFAESLEARVLAEVIKAGEHGLTAQEARIALGLPVEKQYSVSPRLSRLKGKRLVRVTSQVRDRFQVYVAAEAVTEVAS